jgi:hypothetical protein
VSKKHKTFTNWKLAAAVFGLENLSARQTLVLGAICRHYPYAWPGYKTLMKYSKTRSRRVLARTLKELERAGWIRRKHHAYESNEYWIDCKRILKGLECAKRDTPQCAKKDTLKEVIDIPLGISSNIETDRAMHNNLNKNSEKSDYQITACNTGPSASSDGLPAVATTPAPPPQAGTTPASETGLTPFRPDPSAPLPDYDADSLPSNEVVEVTQECLTIAGS